MSQVWISQNKDMFQNGMLLRILFSKCLIKNSVQNLFILPHVFRLNVPSSIDQLGSAENIMFTQYTHKVKTSTVAL